jgi:hypothetical protein
MDVLLIHCYESELQALGNWLDKRDAIIIRAYAIGINKNRIHRLTGISRSTIDRILKVSAEYIPRDE